MKNRTVMSAMTRNFADRNHYCTDEMAAYYERRAKDGVALILTEGIIIHPSADGYNNVPYIWKDEHAQSWEKAVNRVHEFIKKGNSMPGYAIDGGAAGHFKEGKYSKSVQFYPDSHVYKVFLKDDQVVEKRMDMKIL